MGILQKRRAKRGPENGAGKVEMSRDEYAFLCMLFRVGFICLVFSWLLPLSLLHVLLFFLLRRAGGFRDS